MEVDCGFQAVDFGGLVVDSGGFRLIAVFRQTEWNIQAAGAKNKQ